MADTRNATYGEVTNALLWIDDVVQDICELPDRDSPEGRPDLMLVTATELRDIIERHCPEAKFVESETGCSKEEWLRVARKHDELLVRLGEVERELFAANERNSRLIEALKLRCSDTAATDMNGMLAARSLLAEIGASETATHTDHPSRHWDRTCPACSPQDSPQSSTQSAELRGSSLARKLESVAKTLDSDGYPHGAEWVREAITMLSATAATWIPVTERLPDDRGPWLVYGEDGQDVTTCHPSWWNTKDPRGSEFDGPEITHWMPLPEVPAPDRSSQ